MTGACSGMEKDLYSAILGIGPGTRPPDHYTLLGITRFERDPKAIHRAGLQRMKALKAWDLYPDAETQAGVQRLQNEVGAALAALEDADHRRRYDRALATELGVAPPSQEAVARRLSGDGLRAAIPILPGMPHQGVPDPPVPAYATTTPAAAEGGTPTDSLPEEPATVLESVPGVGGGWLSSRRLARAVVVPAAACTVLAAGIWSNPALRSRFLAAIGRPERSDAPLYAVCTDSATDSGPDFGPGGGIAAVPFPGGPPPADAVPVAAAPGATDEVSAPGGLPGEAAPPLGARGTSAAPGSGVQFPVGSVDGLLAALESEADADRRRAVIAQLGGRGRERARDVAPVLYRIFLTDSDRSAATMAKVALTFLGVDVLNPDAEGRALVAVERLGEAEVEAAAGWCRDARNQYHRHEIARSLVRMAPAGLSGPWGPFLYSLFLLEPNPAYRQEIAQGLERADVSLASCRTAATAAVIADQIAAGSLSDGDARVAELALHQEIRPETLAVLGEALTQRRAAAGPVLAAIDTEQALTVYLGVLRAQRADFAFASGMGDALMLFRRQSDRVVAYVKGLDAARNTALWRDLIPGLSRRPWQAEDARAPARVLVALVCGQMDASGVPSPTSPASRRGPLEITGNLSELSIGGALQGDRLTPVVTALGQLLVGTPDAQERLACAAILGHVGTGRDQAVAALAQALGNDRDATVRRAAAGALGTLCHDVATAGPALQQGLLRDRDPAVRAACARAFGAYHDKRAEQPLRQALARDPDGQVKEAVKEALSLVSFHDYLGKPAPPDDRSAKGSRQSRSSGADVLMFGSDDERTSGRRVRLGDDDDDDDVRRSGDPNEAWKERHRKYWQKIGK